MRIPQEEIAYGFKIVILGAGGVGKTCLFNRYCFNSFNMNTELTMGINFHTTYMNIHRKDGKGNGEDKYIINSIFDLAGQERFKPLIPKFIKGAHGALLVFDSLSFSSFQQLDDWYNNIIENVEDPDIPKILVGSKSDLLESANKAEIVNNDLIQDFIKLNRLDGFFRTSALQNYNVLEVFKEITNLMLQNKKEEIILV